MKPPTLQFNKTQWTTALLGENALLLNIPPDTTNTLPIIHKTTALLEAATLPHVTDIVPAYTSIAIIFDVLKMDIHQLIEQIKTIKITEIQLDNSKPTIHHIPVDYNQGLDWHILEQHTKLPKAEIIKRHSAVEYQVAMMGFLPGFVYLSGMDTGIACPRKANPRTRVPAGAVGIGGTQTGMYAFPCPGGWQIIGQTNVQLFDAAGLSPNVLKVGDRVWFVEE